MKRQLLIFCLLFLTGVGYSQKGSHAPYLRSPVFPSVKLLLPDKTTFTKSNLPVNTASLLLIFDPQCEACQHETEELLRNIDKLKNVEIVMATIAPYDSMMKFRDKYGLARYSNIVVGQDTKFFLPGFYKMDMLPFLAFYGKQKDLIKVFKGPMKIKDVIEVFK